VPRPRNKNIDWERIEADYRAGIKTNYEIAAEHKTSEGNIRREAKKNGWEKDLTARIQTRVATLVRSNLTAGKEGEIVDSAAQMLAVVEMDHMAGCRRTRELLNDMLKDYEAEYSGATIRQRLPVISKLVETQDKLYSMERKILRLDTAPPGQSDMANKSIEVHFVRC
jgi:hypothetical protein